MKYMKEMQRAVKQLFFVSICKIVSLRLSIRKKNAAVHTAVLEKTPKLPKKIKLYMFANYILYITQTDKQIHVFQSLGSLAGFRKFH